MTACVNRKHTKKVAAVVTASLVGALSLGAAPVAAMADTGIETLALSAQDAFEQGTMTEARDGQNRRLEIPADGIITVESGKWVVPTEITPKDGDPVDIDKTWVSYTDPSGATVAPGSTGAFSTPGTYTVTVTVADADSSYNGATFTTTFIVEDEADLTNATLFDGKGGVSDTTFTYRGKAQDVQVALNGKKLVKDTDYEMDLYKTLNADGSVPAGADSNGYLAVSDAVDAGTYVANIFEVGATHDAAHLEKQITFTVGKLDLASASVSVADMDSVSGPNDTVTTVSINGDAFTIGSGVNAVATLPSNSTGKASAIVSAAAGQSNISGSKTVEFNIVNKVLGASDVSYNNTTPFTNAENINLADGESFKPERIQVFDGSDVLPSSYYTVTYTDGNGNSVDATALSTPGTYFVTVRLNAEASHYKYGSGDITKRVEVNNGTVTSADIVFKYNGEIGNSFTKDYDGENFLDQLETTVHTQWGDDLVEGTDYTVTVYNADGDKVDSIVDAGSYRIVINVSGYGSIAEADRTCYVTVDPMDLTYGLSVNGGDLTTYSWDSNDDGYNDQTVWYLSYTGETLEPVFELGYYTDADGKVAPYTPWNASELTWNALPTDAYTVTGYQYSKDVTPYSFNDVDNVEAKGVYKVKFALENGNYDIVSSADDENTANWFTVSSDRVAFADVDPNEWYAESVFQAKQLGYIMGIQGSNLYAPNAAISRADALVIISRMAGADVAYGEDWLSQNIGYVTRYSDVDENAYYAKAIAWATKVGIVHGYGDGTFAPTKQITREEFATMLANYAKAAGNFDAADGSALDGMSDAASVSDWAEESVAWAVENGVMGNGGFIAAQSDITRAEVAAMAVNYQPDGVSSDVIG